MKVIGYMVTAPRRDFRRVGRTFLLGVPTRVDVGALTTIQAEALAASNPRDLIVEVIREAAPSPASIPAAAFNADEERRALAEAAGLRVEAHEEHVGQLRDEHKAKGKRK